MADRPEFAQVFTEYAPLVHRAVTHLAGPYLEVDDLVQDVMVEVLASLETFRGESALRTWLYGVTLRVVSAARRRARFRRFLRLESVPDPATHETPGTSAERRQAVLRIHALLERLPEKKRTVVVLFELEGLSCQEIADTLGCPLPTVWTRLHHARRDLVRLAELEERQEQARAQARPGARP